MLQEVLGREGRFLCCFHGSLWQEKHQPELFCHVCWRTVYPEWHEKTRKLGLCWEERDGSCRDFQALQILLSLNC